MRTDPLVNCVLWARMRWLHWTHCRPFIHAAKHPGETQRQFLVSLLHRDRETQFGRQHGFARLTSYADFARAVPVQTYETLRPYIEEQDRTGEPVLTADAPVMYAQTSGTTGKAKRIPILQETLLQHKWSQALQSSLQFAAAPEAYYGRLIGIVSPAEEGTLESGRPYGSTSGYMYKNMPAVARMKYVLPHQVFDIEDYNLKYLLILRLAAVVPNVTFIACANPSTLVKLLSVLDTHRDELMEDITDGTFRHANDLPADVRAAIAPRLSCEPDRLVELQTILGGPQPTFAQLWPQLRLVTTWTGGSCRIALASVRQTLPPAARVAELGYLSSELRGTVVVDLETNAGVPTIHENFFEFVERDDWDAGRHVFRTIEHIEQDKQYYIVASTGAGLYRYFMNDIVTVTGAFHATPTIQFVQKGKGVTNITGEKLYESQVIQAVRSTEEEIGLASTFFLMLADADQAVYRLVVECTTPTDTWRSGLLAAVERALGELNVEYAVKRASGRLRHLELLPVKPGTGDAYKLHCVRQGQREGQFKLIALQYQNDCSFRFADFRIDLPTETAT